MSTMNIFDMSDLWNDGATTFAGIKLNVTDTASASGSLLMDLQVGGSSRFKVDKTGAVVISDGTSALTIDSSNGATTLLQTFSMVFQTSNALVMRHGNGDPFSIRAVSSGEGRLAFLNTSNTKQVELTPDAANTLAQRNGVNAQAFRVYNTFTDASNYERGKMEWASNVLRIGTEKAGTGTARALELQTDGVTRVTVGTDGETNVIGSLRIGTDATKGIISYTTNIIRFNPHGSAWFEIGPNTLGFNGWDPNGVRIGSTGNESGTTNRAGTPILIRPRGGSGDGAGSFVALFNSLPTTSGTVGHIQELAIQTWLPATGTPGLQFGGTTSSFPALKRSTTSLQARLADDSAFTNIQGKLTTETAYTAGAPTATGYIVLYDSNGTAYKIPAEAL